MCVNKVAMHEQEEFVRKQATMRIKIMEEANSDSWPWGPIRG